jgi:nitrile hydratase
MDGVHDMGGVDGFGPVVTDDGHVTHHEAWEPRAQVISLVALLSMRDAIERLDPATYLASSYYERWLRAAEERAVQRQLITQDELAHWHDTLAADPSAAPSATNADVVEFIRALGPHQHGAADRAAFSEGDAVRVRRMRPEHHHRCPRYIRGAIGRVERVLGADAVPVPEGEDREVEACYTVEFASTDLFGPPGEGAQPYVLLIDLWERYLEATP